ncbi:MAG: FAD-binding oxidoreductase, partial [Burkholderiales bacterium]|nr:FAD-binding oxidoreductase [Burkholderiales bacterium]
MMPQDSAPSRQSGVAAYAPKTDLPSQQYGVDTDKQDTELKVAVIGAGVAGITTAWELTTEGHKVTIFDKAGGIAEGASFGSPGWIGLAGLTGWDNVSPIWPKVGPWGLTTSASWWRRPGALRWLSALKKHNAPAHQPALFSANLDLAALSVDRLRRTVSQPGVDVERSQGMMVLMRSETDLAPYRQGLHRLANRDIKIAEIDAASAKQLEPGLSDDIAPAARWWLADDEIINGRQWLNIVKADLLRLGCVVQMNTQVIALNSGGNLTYQVASQPRQSQTFDAVVVCAGHQ